MDIEEGIQRGTDGGPVRPPVHHPQAWPTCGSTTSSGHRMVTQNVSPPPPARPSRRRRTRGPEPAQAQNRPPPGRDRARLRAQLAAPEHLQPAHRLTGCEYFAGRVDIKLALRPMPHAGAVLQVPEPRSCTGGLNDNFRAEFVKVLCCPCLAVLRARLMRVYCCCCQPARGLAVHHADQGQQRTVPRSGRLFCQREIGLAWWYRSKLACREKIIPDKPRRKLLASRAKTMWFSISRQFLTVVLARATGVLMFHQDETIHHVFIHFVRVLVVRI
ncbi:hypothetical protein Btru_026231 [Bulinus truncatus]|nr:hypothetical protein Btru_026231 [Bulinus truncatus]